MSQAAAAGPVDRRIARALGVGVAALCLLTFHGFLNLTDGFSMFSVTRSIVEDADLTVPERPLVSVEGRDGRPYSKYGIGLPAMSIPSYAAGWAVAAVTGHRDLLTELAVTALVPVTYGLLAAATYRLGRRLGAGSAAALLVAVGSILGTFLLAYSQEFFSEPLVALLVVVATERLLAGRALPAGAALAIAVVTRPQTAVILPFFALGALMRGRWRAVGELAAPVAAGGVVILLYNLARFADPFSTGYEGERFDTPVGEGAWGLLASPDKSVLVFAPAVVLVPWALARLARRDRLAALLSGGVLAAVFVSTATWHSWQGGYSWGPRLLIPALPVALATVAPWLDAEPFRRRAAAALFALGFVVSASTLLVPTTAQLVYTNELGDDGPTVMGQYELVDDVLRNTADRECHGATRPVSDVRHCSAALWQVELGRRAGAAGWAFAAAASAALVAVGLVAVRLVATGLAAAVRVPPPRARTSADGTGAMGPRPA